MKWILSPVCRNEEDYFLRMALKLGHRHGISNAELVSTHVSTLFLSDLSPSEISARLSDPGLKGLIKESTDQVVER